MWKKVPRLDACGTRTPDSMHHSKVFRKSLLAFEDTGILRDPLDRRMELYLKRAWDSSVSNLKPAIKTTCVERNLEFCLTQLKAHVEAGHPREVLVHSFSMLFKAIDFVAEALAELVRMSGRTSGLINFGRRALWLKSWSGNTASKLRFLWCPFFRRFALWA